MNKTAIEDTTLKITPLAGAIGAEISNLDLSGGADDKTCEAIRLALRDHLALVIPGKCALGSEQLVEFMRNFGRPDDQPFTGSFQLPHVDGNPYVFGFVKEAADRRMNLGGFWHADVTCRTLPHKMGMLYCADAPSVGGDTLFSNQYLAYEALSEGMKEMLQRLRAVHSSDISYGRKPAYLGAVGRNHAPQQGDAEFSTESYNAGANPNLEENVHPVVCTHPDTKRPYLFVNRAFTNRFENMTPEESRPLLEFLWTHSERPEFTCRVRWHKYTTVLWDNRCVLHYALNDYFGERREMHRVAVHDDAPG
jgi:taurine dioxygenase